MAAKRRRRRKTAVAPARRRRRRRNPGALAAARRVRANPPRPSRRRRRRRHAVARTRRRFRRNPSIASARGMIGGIMQGLYDGGAVVVGQVAVRKVRGAITGMLPQDVQTKIQAPGLGNIALKLAAALGVSVIARKAVPAQSRMIAAGAFSEVINGVLATTPIAPYLSAWPSTRRALSVPANVRAIAAPGRAGVSAWPGSQVPRQGVSGYPRSVGMPTAAGVL